MDSSECVQSVSIDSMSFFVAPFTALFISAFLSFFAFVREVALFILFALVAWNERYNFVVKLRNFKQIDCIDCLFFVSFNDLSVNIILSMSQGHDENRKSTLWQETEIGSAFSKLTMILWKQFLKLNSFLREWNAF